MFINDLILHSISLIIFYFFVNPFVHLFIHWFNFSFINFFISYIDLLIYSISRSLTQSCIYWLFNLLIYSLIRHFIRSFTHSFNSSFLSHLISRQRDKSKQTDGSPLALFNFFVDRTREMLHIVLAMSPIGDAFRNRLRKFPSLVNCCTIDWFQVSSYHLFQKSIINSR